MTDFITLTEDGEIFTCKMPADESVVEVRLKDGSICRAFFSFDDEGCDFAPVGDDDEPTDGNSLLEQVEAWRYPQSAATSPASNEGETP